MLGVNRFVDMASSLPTRLNFDPDSQMQCSNVVVREQMSNASIQLVAEESRAGVCSDRFIDMAASFEI